MTSVKSTDDPPLIDTGPEQLHQSLMNTCEQAYKKDVLPALYVALNICKDDDRPLPPWVLDAVIEFMELAFNKKLSKGTGFTAHPIERLRNDIRHYVRWEAVIRVKSAPIKVPSLEVYDKAANLLTETPYCIGPDAIKDSYYLVEKALADPAQAGRFFLITHPAVKKLGLPTNQD